MTVRCSAGLTGLLELHSSQNGFWFPHAYFDSRYRSLQVVDYQTQFVLTGDQLIRNFKLENGTYRLGLPPTCRIRKSRRLSEDVIPLKDPSAFGIVQAQRN